MGTRNTHQLASCCPCLFPGGSWPGPGQSSGGCSCVDVSVPGTPENPRPPAPAVSQLPLPTPMVASPHTLVSSQEELLKTQIRKCHSFAQNHPHLLIFFRVTVLQVPCHLALSLSTRPPHFLSELTGLCPGLHTSLQ